MEKRAKKELVLKRIHKHEHIVYLMATQFRQNKRLVINTRRILYIKEINQNKTLIFLNSGFKLTVVGSFDEISRLIHKDIIKVEFIDIDKNDLIKRSNTKQARKLKKA